MDEQQVETQVDPGQKAEDVVIGGKELSYLDDLNYHHFADFLDVSTDDRRDPNIASKLSYLYDWAKEATGTEDRVSILEAIDGLKKRLGLPMTGPELTRKLFQYTRLDMDKRRIEREMKLYEHKS